MRVLLAALFLCFLALDPAQAAHHHKHWRHWSRHIHQRHAHPQFAARYSLPAPCRVAASMGGPCGCWAAFTLLGVLDHVWHGINLWLADDWLKFPRTTPAVGTAAIWPHRHVAPVVAINHDGTVTVKDSWAIHRVRMVGLIFVQPPIRKREGVRYAGAVPL